MGPVFTPNIHTCILILLTYTIHMLRGNVYKTNGINNMYVYVCIYAGTITTGGVQWMTAGRGIIHRYVCVCVWEREGDRYREREIERYIYIRM